MSLEDRMDALTKAVTSLEATISKMGGAAPAAAGKGAGKPAAGKPAASKKKEGPTLETIKEKFGGYLAGQKGAEKAKRMAQVGSINEYFGVERATMLDEDKYEEALGYLEQFENGEVPEFDGAYSGEEEEGVV